MVENDFTWQGGKKGVTLCFFGFNRFKFKLKSIKSDLVNLGTNSRVIIINKTDLDCSVIKSI